MVTKIKNKPKKPLPGEYHEGWAGPAGYGITGIFGPEGSGKSCLMAAMGYAHWNLGGRLFSFPGFQVFADDEHKELITEELPVQAWANLPPEINNSVILIDQIENFFSRQNARSIMTSLFTNLEGQRRKRNLGIVYTTQQGREIPSIVYEKTHYVTYMWDMFWSNAELEEKVERGTLSFFKKYDNLGFRTGHPGMLWEQGYFHPQLYWGKYDTDAVIDFWQRLSVIKFLNKPTFEIDLGGKDLPEQTGAKAMKTPEQLTNETTERMTFYAEKTKEGMTPASAINLWKFLHPGN